MIESVSEVQFSVEENEHMSINNGAIRYMYPSEKTIASTIFRRYPTVEHLFDATIQAEDESRLQASSRLLGAVRDVDREGVPYAASTIALLFQLSLAIQDELGSTVANTQEQYQAELNRFHARLLDWAEDGEIIGAYSALVNYIVEKILDESSWRESLLDAIPIVRPSDVRFARSIVPKKGQKKFVVEQPRV